MIYAARYDSMNALIAYLTKNCCGGAAKKCAPRACRPARKSALRKKEAVE
jgi:ArsR family transcriptional regulator